MDEEDEASAKLARLADAHIRSALHLTAVKSRWETGEAASIDFNQAIAAEASARESLIAWSAPDASLLMDKLLHLLVHVVEGDLAFDELSLARITTEVGRFIGRNSETPGA